MATIGLADAPGKVKAGGYTDIFIRENIVYQASTALLVRSGVDLGSTMHGHHDFQLGDDPLHKVHIGHYTFYSKAIIRNAKYLIRAPGVFVRQYMKGENANDIKFLGRRFTEVTEKPLMDVMHFNELVADIKPPSDADDSSHIIRIPDYNRSTTELKYFIHGTSYSTKEDKVVEKFINTLGFGEHTYPGCKSAREGRGVS